MVSVWCWVIDYSAVAGPFIVYVLVHVHVQDDSTLCNIIERVHSIEAVRSDLRPHNYFYDSEAGRQYGHEPSPVGWALCNADNNSMSMAAILELAGQKQ